MKALAIIATITVIISGTLTVKQAPPPSTAELAASIGMTEEEFLFISAVTEAESDRSTETDETGTTPGRVMIALCIMNRQRSSIFPDTIPEVLTQPGQFSTVRNGHSIVEPTDLSNRAVIIAAQWLESGEAPEDVLFFNCVGYNYGEPYGTGPIGGNYFMTYGG